MILHTSAGVQVATEIVDNLWEMQDLHGIELNERGWEELFGYDSSREGTRGSCKLLLLIFERLVEFCPDRGIPSVLLSHTIMDL